jgi:GNAT superfamily N-acetyltransferase
MPEGLGAVRWWWILRRCRHDEQVFLYYPNVQDAEYQVLMVCSREGHDHAILIWQVCHQCRCGLIAKISMIPEWQGQGLGRRLINRALRDGPQYQWTTSSQSPEGRRFFPVLAKESGALLTVGPACAHIEAAKRTFPRPRLERGV